MEEQEPKEQNLGGGKPTTITSITLQQAIDFGEYKPEYLANFAEWHTLSSHVQWQLIRKALEIRHHQMITHYGELNNVLDYSKKPHVQAALKKLERQLAEFMKDREKLYIEYSDKI